MRKIKAISPSSLATWEYNREEYYLKYLAEDRPARPPQEIYMAAGSSFDAFVKSEIHLQVFGPGQNRGSQYEFQTIFESQVEPQCRDEALKMGEFLFKRYVHSGAMKSLMDDINASPYAPQMEFQIEKEVNGVPLLGKPDLRYITPMGVHVIADWKVNGAYSTWGVSPVQGFKCSRSYDRKTSSWKTESHKKYFPKQHGDIEVNINCLSDFSPDWATQLTMYAWCLGEEPGDENFVVRMEQFACRPGGIRSDGELQTKIVTHMSNICGRFQMNVMQRLLEMWSALERGHIFTDMTLEQSIENCEMVEKKAALPLGLHPALNFSLTEKGPRFK